jgi:hypothetical protein
MSKQVWIPGFEGHYKATKEGDIYSCKELIIYKDGRVAKRFTKKKLKLTTNHKGYYVVYLSVASKKHSVLVHRLIAKTFIKNHAKKTQINHINCNKKDNRVSNLEWVTNAENMAHGSANGLFKRKNIKYGSQMHTSKLVEKEVLEIRARYKQGNCTYQSLGEDYGVSLSTISDICKRRCWTHI